MNFESTDLCVSIKNNIYKEKYACFSFFLIDYENKRKHLADLDEKQIHYHHYF